MNTSQFMDKQIMELSGSGSRRGGDDGGDLLELLGDTHQSNGTDDKKNDIVPSYDFQPIRTSVSLPSNDGGRAWGSADSTKVGPSNPRARNYGSSEAHDSNVIQEKNKEAHDAVILAEFDRTVKKHADHLLHALEGVCSRLSKLEGRTQDLESSVDDLKLSIADNSGSTDGKLRQLENILREVQNGVQVLRDKQEIVEAQIQLAKMQVSKGDHQLSDEPAITSPESVQPHVQLPQRPLQQPAQSLVAPPLPSQTMQQLPALSMAPAPNAPPPPPPPQQNPPPSQFTSQVPQPQVPSVPSMPVRETYFLPQGQPLTEVLPQPYQLPPQQPSGPPPQQYPPAPAQHPTYSQPPPPAQPLQPSRLVPLPHLPDDPSLPYMPPPQTYPPGMHQLPQPPSGPPQFYGSGSSSLYEPPQKIRPTSGQQSSAAYGSPSGPSFSDSYSYGSGSPSHYSSGMRSSPFSSSSIPRLPTAQVLPQALPTPTGGGSSSTSSGGNRVPIDDVVDKVATMGFPRDLVRATVRRLTENGQNVDLNVVLDKLMNDTENQPPKGWFGR